MIVRARDRDDLDSCERLAQAVHAVDGYPPRPATPDLRSFIASASALATWVADDDGDVVGHIALNPGSAPEVMALASWHSGAPAASLGVVARLLVAPERRRQGIATALLATAADAARQRGLIPILDVAAHFDAARALYEKHGWLQIGRVTATIDGCEPLDEFVSVAPTS